MYNPVYTQRHTEAAMPMGGLGTGGFSIGSRGELRDWELMNHPDTGNRFPYTFFALHASIAGKRTSLVLESQRVPPYARPQGYVSNTVAGLPRFDRSRMGARFPFVEIALERDGLPLDVTLEAFGPFIPLNADDSSIPASLLRYRVRNRSGGPVTVSVAGSLFNASGFLGMDQWENARSAGTPHNVSRAGDGLRGVYFDNDGLDREEDPLYGNLTLAVAEDCGGTVTAKPEWDMGQRNDGIHGFWDDFASDGLLEAAPAKLGAASRFDGFVQAHIGSIALTRTLSPGEEAAFEFILAWSFPNRPRAWPQDENLCRDGLENGVARNYYATLFPTSWDAAAYLRSNLARLEGDSRLFSDALYGSTLPDEVIGAVAGNLATLKSQTCFRLDNGHMFGFEGCLEHIGSCPGNCTHVWYYAQAMAFLFPELERSMRETDFLVETNDEGEMQFRAMTELCGRRWDFLPAVDGQMGSVVRLWREWLLSGDKDFLRRLWPKAVQALEYGIRLWDTDGDGVLDGMMHVDYDVEFYGPNPLGNFCCLAALRAAQEIARVLGDEERRQRYGELFERASRRVDEALWNGEYYRQVLPDVDTYKYQHGEGCLADQLIGQFLAWMTGLGDLAPREHLERAMESIFRYNFRSDLRDHENVQRAYAVGREGGLLMTTWPHGGRPRYPFFYSDEVWSRTEYHVAASLIYAGRAEEGLQIVRAVQDRYDGCKRNPFNEFEYGYHYAGIMSSYALLPALSGCRIEAPGRMTFHPVYQPEHFCCFWCDGLRWGVYRQELRDGKLVCETQVLYQPSCAT